MQGQAANGFLRKLGRFVDLTATEKAVLDGATAHPRRFAAKKDLIREGDHPGSVFVMLDGWALRYKILPNGTRQIMAFLMPGDACDLTMGTLTAMDHGIQTVTEARVAVIAKGDMHRLMAEHRGIARAMYIARLVDVGTLRAWIVSMGRRSSIERVAHLVCELYVRAHAGGLVLAEEFELPLSQVILADALGMTPVHLNRIAKQLRAEGVMTLRRGSVRIIDPGKLVRIAGFDANYLHRRQAQPAKRLATG